MRQQGQELKFFGNQKSFIPNRLVLYKHLNDHLIKSCHRYFDGIIQSVPFWDFPLFILGTLYNFEIYGRFVVLKPLQEKIH